LDSQETPTAMRKHEHGEPRLVENLAQPADPCLEANSPDVKRIQITAFHRHQGSCVQLAIGSAVQSEDVCNPHDFFFAK